MTELLALVDAFGEVVVGFGGVVATAFWAGLVGCAVLLGDGFGLSTQKNSHKDFCLGCLVVCKRQKGHMPWAVLIMAENGWNWPMLADFFLLFSAHFGQFQPFSAIIKTAQGKCPF